ncbi:hypothetical protein TBLA_0D05440 [Henningerozyma blattae CBS 6284]|uniref:DNA 3'-5' helicase n=1 Tax=Henningerozyma blattae (strain ATCC 34711 / CBS 6284 / DSM 70876 / NBRC 10599 / NRRL Y-10934 / UCD 77-7) TaxID=1071380 RepID=I2H3T5_HENB6|nr:hypothetical protein TBLA_0D05440 [Tetrapisispora blattae CBS 6284]CCH61037.1 hypothetical protein TBLA_0D05440 [Tetrapisispora blattae CBS 6284]
MSNDDQTNINSTNNLVLNDILSTLNKQQLMAVTYDPGKALQIIAGPGTGKTKVLTSRVAYLLLHHKILPQDIIVTTFTNKAATEMIERLTKMLENTHVRVSDLLIGTFHGVCMKLLTRFGHILNLRKDWRIVDEKEVDAILNNMVDKMPDQIRDYATSMSKKVNLCLPKRSNNEWAVHPKMVKKQISRLKAFAILQEEYQADNDHDVALSYFYEKYQTELNKINSFDFDDLLMYAFRLLTKERCLPNIRHVLVDEFQDTNGIQTDLMFLFARGNHHLSHGITVVGDPDQSIYAFRHALSHNFEEMIRKSPLHISQVILIENYRSSQKILDTSETLISQQSSGRKARLPLHAQFDCNFPPVYLTFPTNFLEAPSLTREILYLKSLPNLFSYNDIAILVRQRRQIRRIENSLIENRIPYKIIRGHAFWELKEVSTMLNLLKCVNSNEEKNAILSCLTYPSKGLGPVSIEKISKIFDEHDGPSFEILKSINNRIIPVDIPTKGKQAISEFIGMIESCINLYENPLENALSEIFERLYDTSGLKQEYLYFDGKKKSNVDLSGEPDYTNPRHKNVELLKSHFLGLDKTNIPIIQTTSQETPKNIVSNYIRNFFVSLSLYSTEAEGEEEKLNDDNKNHGYVTISTIHGAKGLEWPVVLIPGCNEGIIPSLFRDEGRDSEDTQNDDEDGNTSDSTTNDPNSGKQKQQSGNSSLDEERRMFFVAQTRAKYLLYITSVTSNDEQYPSEPSRFLSKELLSKTSDRQYVFDDLNTIKSLYKAMGKKFLENIQTFSYKQLIEDYNKCVDDRRERFIWNGKSLVNTFNVDLTKNKTITGTSEFTTAAAQLKTNPNSISTSKLFGKNPQPKPRGRQNNPIPSSKYQLSPTKSSSYTQKTSNESRSIARNLSPTKTYAPSYTGRINGGPVSPQRNLSPVKTFAPKYKSTPNSRSPSPKKTYAPSYAPNNTTNNANKDDTSNTSNNILTNRQLFAPTPTTLNRGIPTLSRNNSSLTNYNNNNNNNNNNYNNDNKTKNKNKLNTIPSNKSNSNPIKIEKDIEIESQYIKQRTSSRRNTKVVAKPINLQDYEEKNEINRLKQEDDEEDVTAAEILHDPNDFHVDNRPIIASAKLLADAVQQKKSKKDDIFPGKKPIVKKEIGSSQFDIFSQLSRARKKAKTNDGEIIIID